jgi:hypothetical protein
MTHSYARSRATFAALACGWLLAGSALLALPAGATEFPRPLIDLVHIQNTTTEAMGGSPILGDGDVLLVVAGQQVFGAIYGSPRHPETPLTLFSLFTRSLGTATVRDADTGQLLARNISMPVRTIVAQRFDLALEYRDQDGDGIFDYHPNLRTADPFDFVPVEPFVKGANLAGDWNLTGFELTAVSDDAVGVAFTLSLDGAGYRRAELTPLPGDGELNRVAFTVHLKITRQFVEAHDVPHFDATVDRSGGRRELASLEPAGTVNGSYTTISARFKVDHDIVGWDFAPPRLDVHSRLLLHTIMVVVNAIDGQLANWLSGAALTGGRQGEVTADTPSNGTVQINGSQSSTDFVRVRSIALGDNWRRLGSLGWTPQVDVYANESSVEPRLGEVDFQVLGGGQVDGRHDGMLFRGFVISGGYSYPAGYRLYHDPVLETSGIEVQPSLLAGLWNAAVIVGQLTVMALAVVGAVVFTARRATGSARAAARSDAQRLKELQERYQLAGPDSPWQEVR